MHEPDRNATGQQRPDAPTGAIPDPLARALLRRLTLDEQQRSFQTIYPPPHLFRRRPPA